jgi:CPA1 family monovalent cation:H+ antiporter
MRARVMALSFDDILERLHTAAEAYRVEERPAREVEDRYRERQARLADGRPLAAMPANQLYIGLGSLANREAELYRQHFDERMISRRIAAQLARQASALLDGLKTGGPYGYALVARAQAGFGPRFRLALWLHDRPRVHWPLAHRLADRFEILLVQGKVLRDLRAFTGASLRPLLGETIGLELDRALAGRLELAETALAALKLQYPDYGRRLEARYLERAALRMEDAAYRRLFAESVIGREVFNSLMRDLRARRREADREPRLDLGMEVDDLVRRVPLFAAIDDAGVRELAGLLKPRLGLPGELLVRRGARNDRRMYFIASGAVEVDVPPKPVRLGTGDFFGELALLAKRPRNADVTMIGYGQLLVLEGRDFHRFLRSHPDIRERIHEVARARQGLRRGA